MRLNSLALQPYGALTDATLEFGDGLTVVYGLNEAGKSTLLSAYADLLCGIPRQTPMAFLVGRPRLDIHAGITTDGGTTVEVVRTSKNAPNDLRDAATSEPVAAELRQTLLPGLTHDGLTARFGLDHDRLVAGGRELMHGHGNLASIVFEARSGADVRKLVDELEARTAALYTPRKNSSSELIRASTSRDELSARLIETLATAEEVETAATRQQQTEDELGRRRLEATRVRTERARLVQLVESWPYWEQYRARRDELAQAEADGRRLTPEQLQAVADHTARLDEIAAEIDTQTKQAEQARSQRSGLAVDEALLAVQPAVDTLAKDKHRADEARARLVQLDREASEAGAELVALLDRLGRFGDSDPLAALATITVADDRVADLTELAAEGDRFEEQTRTARQAVDEATAAVEAAERDAELARPADDDTDSVDYSRSAASRGHRDALWDHVRRCWIGGQAVAAEIGPDSEALAARYEAAVADADGAADELADEAGRLSQEQRNRLTAAATAEATAAERRRALSKTEHEFDDIARSQQHWQARWQAAAEAAGLPDGLGTPGWRQRATLLSEAQAAAETLRALQRERAGKTQTVADWDAGTSALSADLGRSMPAEQLVSWFDQTKETYDRSKTNQQTDEVHRRAQEQANERVERLREETATREAAVDEIAADCEVARGELGVLVGRAEAHAAAAAALAGPTRELQARHPEATLAELTGKFADRDGDQLGVDVAAADEELQRADEAVDAAQVFAVEARKAHEELTARTGADALHQGLSQATAGMLDLIEEYATVRLMHHLLTQELQSYLESNRNPVLDRAGAYLSRLTHGRFTGLRADGDGTDRSLAIIGADDGDYDTTGLSEGTAAQLYLALSLAGVVEVEHERRQGGQETIPIMLDDVLMTFDDERAAAALQLLAELGAQHQIVLFTHHESVRDRAESFAEAVKVVSLSPPAVLE